MTYVRKREGIARWATWKTLRFGPRFSALTSWQPTPFFLPDLTFAFYIPEDDIQEVSIGKSSSCNLICRILCCCLQASSHLNNLVWCRRRWLNTEHLHSRNKLQLKSLRGAVWDKKKKRYVFCFFLETAPLFSLGCGWYCSLALFKWMGVSCSTRHCSRR